MSKPFRHKRPRGGSSNHLPNAANSASSADNDTNQSSDKQTIDAGHRSGKAQNAKGGVKTPFGKHRRQSDKKRAGKNKRHSNGSRSPAALEKADSRQNAPNRVRTEDTQNKAVPKGRRNSAQSGLRGVRAAVQPTPDAAYVGKAGQKTGYKRSKGRGRTPHSPNSGDWEGHAINRRSRFRPRQPAAKVTGPLFAALDLGTNNCRLLVATPGKNGRFHVVDGFSKIVRLGESLEQTGKLSETAMTRALEALGICAQKLAGHKILAQRLIATEACRKAENGEEFLNHVTDKTGLELEIIDRQTEAYLAAEGCSGLIDRKAEAVVMFDIGGGSSELALIDRGNSSARIDKQIIDWVSLPLGVVTLAERYGADKISQKVFDQMVGDVEKRLSDFRNSSSSFDTVWQCGRRHLMGTSGTVTTLAGIHLNLPRYSRRHVDGMWLDGEAIETVIGQLLKMDWHARAANPCVGKDRADLVLAGCAILQAIRRTWVCDWLRVADRGLREGILLQLMRQHLQGKDSQTGVT